jgi:hypothetical protein
MALSHHLFWVSPLNSSVAEISLRALAAPRTVFTAMPTSEIGTKFVHFSRENVPLSTGTFTGIQCVFSHNHSFL